MNSKSWHLINKAVTELFRPDLSLGNFPERATASVRHLVSCDLAGVASLNPNSGQLEVFFDDVHSDLDRGLEGFARHMAKYPFSRFDPWINDGKPFFRADFMPDARFRDSDIYADGFRVARIRDHGAVPIHAREKDRVFLGVERCVKAGFSSEDRSRLEVFQPHLINARSIALNRARLDLRNIDESAFVGYGLTPAESRVMGWLVNGKSNLEIAEILGLRLSTVKGHVMSIFNRLGVDNRHAAVLQGLKILHHLKEASVRDRTLRTRVAVG